MNKQGLLLILAVSAPLVQADVTLPKVIDSQMVLQRDREVPIWGWADPAEEVTVEFAGQVKKAMPDATGKWMVKLDRLTASAESRAMTVKGKNVIQLDDVLVGEVWLASGQSNMEWPLPNTVPEEWSYAQTQKGNRLVRAFHVSEHLLAGVPMDDTIGSWKNAAEMVASPHSVSAVGFFFALKLQKELGIPVAFLDSNWGGQAIEQFIPDEGYKAVGFDLPAHGKMPDMKNTAGMLNALADDLKAAAKAAEKGRSVGFPQINLNPIYGNAPNGICNAMISPLAPYALRGAIWYQGESNRGRPDYFEKLKALSAGWSSIFQVQSLPILLVQIAPFDYSRGANPQDSTLCDTIWAAQYRASQEIPGIGIVPIQDTGISILDIHPKNKRPVGERLAALALKTHYGKDVVAKGPSFASAKRSGLKVVVTLKDIGQGLVTSDEKAPSWFELSADGKTFTPADAVIAGNTVEVSAATVQEPNYVRMGWRDIALPNLKDKTGWPVFAFASQAVAAQ